MLNFFNKFKDDCHECKKTYRRKHLVNYAGRWYCSEKCMRKSFKDMTTEELLGLDKIDRAIAQDGGTNA